MLSSLWLLASCAPTSRVLQPGQQLLYRNSFDISMQDGSTVPPEVQAVLADCSKFVKQRPRNGLLNINHTILNTYYHPKIENNSWWARTARSIGVEPVLYNDMLTQASVRQLQSLMDVGGCFGSQVSADTVNLKRNRVEVRYRISAAPRYLIEEVTYAIKDSAISQLVNDTRSQSLLQPGDYYHQDLLSAERERLTALFQDNGYYRSLVDLIRFEVDTTFDNRYLSIRVIVENPIVMRDGVVYQYPYQQYFINHIMVDSVRVSQSVLQRMLVMREGLLYRPIRTTATYNALHDLHNFSLINIDYTESPQSSDSLRLLDVHCRLLENSQQSISASIEISNASPSKGASTSGNFGAETILQYQHRNFFGGAELFSLSGNLLIELQKSAIKSGFSDFRSNFSAFESGITASLNIPQFWMPWGNQLRGRMRPHTLFDIGTDYQYRSYFERMQVKSSFGYTWNASRFMQHRLMPVNVSYVRFFDFSEEFRNRVITALDRRLMYQYDDHLNISARYELTYSNQVLGRRENFSYLHVSIESAGILAAAVATSPGMADRTQYNNQGFAAGRTTDSDGDAISPYNLFSVPYSQYLRLSTEFKRYFHYGESSTLVMRVLLGIGMPYGNSITMPYEKCFFGGGPNNIRAWQLRRLGPGHYNSQGLDSYYWDQTGDMTLVLNLESRFPIFGPIEGALFADAGNVWLFKEDPNQPGAEFQLQNLFTDMALGLGVGLRLKISILTLRFDFALPAYDPTCAPLDRWRFKHWGFRTVQTNVGIDYPF
ncbi:MAG: BamA/TamA family outer membrane protein [Bacteroidales bacterium]|nr:BamA/TamA family outer membrane protein [Candidatus Colimorpha onthohippi]